MTQYIDPGKAMVQPSCALIAGSFATITFSYTAGHPVDDSGYIKIAFRSVSDFGAPQFSDPAAPNYCTVQNTGDCRIELRWDPQGHTRPWSKALFLKVRGGFLDRGEEIVVVFGDRAGGSPGWQMQTFCETTFEFKTLADPIATYQFKELPESPTVRIVSGQAARAVCIAPSQVKVNKAFAYYLKCEDVWGNPTGQPQKLSHPGFPTAGVQTVSASDQKTKLSAQSNPIKVLADDAPLCHYWADFHGQSEETVGSNSIEDYFTFARDYGLLDIVAHQGNDFQVTDAFWTKINQVTEDFYRPGALVTFPGYEWSGNTPLGGDRNIYFASQGGQITRSCTDLLPGNRSMYQDSPTADDLFRNLKERPNPPAFGFAHVGGRYADISMHDPEIELAVEIHSAWGTFEWLLDEALERGYRVGICANSDGHKCRPGASYPGAGDFGSYGGLTCVLARQLDRESVFEALKARHFYATTGNRCLLELELLTGDGRRAAMGDVLELGSGTPHLHVRVIGTAPIESVEVRNGRQVVRTFRPYGKEELGNRLKVVWSGAAVRGRDRMIRWDGGLRVRGNIIKGITPVNFWNPLKPLEQVDDHQLRWKSSTTGGASGVILTLEKPTAGRLEIETPDRRVECELGSVGLTPRVWDLGGLRKQIQVYRLARGQVAREFSFALPLTELHQGDNPIFIRLTQKDGHLAWSSPVYLVR